MKIYGIEHVRAASAIKSGSVTLAVYGLGRMGLPLAAVFASAGAKVIGVDINESVVAAINRGNSPIIGEPGLAELIQESVASERLEATSDSVNAAREADLMIIVVPAGLDSERRPDLSNVKSLYKKISKGLAVGDMVIQESTVPLRCSEDVLYPLMLKHSGINSGEFGFARCPEHGRYGTVIENIKGTHCKVVGGIDPNSTRAAAAVYSVVNETGVISVRNTTTAEAVKLFAASYKDVNIALANELAKVCDDTGIDALEVFETLRRPPAYIPVFQPGCGVGGHCVPVCTYGIRSAVQVDTPLIAVARATNDGMAAYTVGLVQQGLLEYGKALDDANVLVMGLTYRGDIKDTLNSPALTIIASLTGQCNRIYAYDPLLGDEVGQYGTTNINNLTEVGQNIQIDAIVVTSDNSEFTEINWNEFAQRVRHRVIIDGRNVLDLDTMRNNGWTAYGIGRRHDKFPDTAYH